MFTVEVFESCCTGYPDWRGRTFRGIGMSRSVPTAIRKALAELRLDYNSDIEMASEAIVHAGYQISHNGKEILRNDSHLPYLD